MELGSGSSTKTRLLLDALAAAGGCDGTCPSTSAPRPSTVRSAVLARDYPGLELHGVVADFEAHLDRLPTSDGRLVAFLGSTIGNLDPVERSRFFRALRAELGTGDAFLLGVDLVKDEHRLVAAYDDAAGRHRRVQPQRAPGAERVPRCRLPTRAVRSRRPLERRGGVDGDAPCGPGTR